MKNEDGCKYETMDHFIGTYTHIYEFLKLMKSATKQNCDDAADRSHGDNDVMIIMMTIMVMMMDFASIQDEEIRDFVLIVNSENFIQERA